MARIQKATKIILIFNVSPQPVCLHLASIRFFVRRSRRVGQARELPYSNLDVTLVFACHYDFCASANTFGSDLLFPPVCTHIVNVAGQGPCLFSAQVTEAFLQEALPQYL